MNTTMTTIMTDAIVYIAGPFRAKNGRTIEEHVEAARAMSDRLWAAGVPNICPHTLTVGCSYDTPEEIYLEGLLRIVERCDALLLLPHWKESSGTLAEKELAERLGIPCFEEFERCLGYVADGNDSPVRSAVSSVGLVSERIVRDEGPAVAINALATTLLCWMGTIGMTKPLSFSLNGLGVVNFTPVPATVDPLLN